MSPTGESFVTLVDEEMRIVEEVLVFLNHIEKKGLAKNTVDRYCRSLKTYYEWLDFADLKFYEVKKRNMIDFIGFISKDNKSANTINNYVAAISSFYSYLENIDGFIIDNPVLIANTNQKRMPNRIVGQKNVFKDKTNLFRQKIVKKKNNQRLFYEEIQTLYDSISKVYKNEALIARNQLIFKLIYETGIRISECMGLRIPDYSEPSPTEEIGIISLRRHDNIYHNDHSFKTNERDIPVAMSLIYEIDDYILTHRPDSNLIDTIFVNHTGKNKGSYLKRNNISKFFKKISEFSGIECTAHYLRHTHGTELAENGYDQVFISDRLGHSSVESTNKYIHISIKAQIKAYGDFLIAKGEYDK